MVTFYPTEKKIKGKFTTAITFSIPATRSLYGYIVSDSKYPFLERIVYVNPSMKIRDCLDNSRVLEFTKYYLKLYTKKNHSRKIEQIVADMTFVRLSYEFYKKTNLDIFDPKQFHMVFRNSYLHEFSWGETCLVTVFSYPENIKIFIKEFFNKASDISSELFRILNKTSGTNCKKHYFVSFENCYLPCDKTYKRMGYYIEFQNSKKYVLLINDHIYTYKNMKEVFTFLFQEIKKEKNQTIKIYLPWKEMDMEFYRKNVEDFSKIFKNHEFWNGQNS